MVSAYTAASNDLKPQTNESVPKKNTGPPIKYAIDVFSLRLEVTSFSFRAKTAFGLKYIKQLPCLRSDFLTQNNMVTESFENENPRMW